MWPRVIAKFEVRSEHLQTNSCTKGFLQQFDLVKLKWILGSSSHHIKFTVTKLRTPALNTLYVQYLCYKWSSYILTHFLTGGGSYTLKLAFSPSSSISPTAPTVAPAVAAAAVAVSNGANPLGPIGSPVHPRCIATSPISLVTNGVKELNGDAERNGLSPERLTTSSP